MKKLFAMLCVAVCGIVAGCGPSADSEQRMISDYRQRYDEAASMGNTDEMLRLSKAFCDTAEMAGHSNRLRGYAKSLYGQTLMLTGDAAKGKPLLDETLSMALASNDDTLLLEVYNGLGLYEMKSQANNFAATEYFLKALSVTPEDDIDSQMNILLNIAASAGLNRDTTGLKYAERCYDLARKQENKLIETVACLHVGTQMGFRKLYDEQKKWIERAAKIPPPSTYRSMIDMQMSDVLVLQERPSEAAFYANRALDSIRSAAGLEDHMLPDAYYEKAVVENKLGRYAESLRWLTMVDTLMTRGQGRHLEKNVRKWQAMDYAAMGLWHEAFMRQQVYTDIVNSQADNNRTNILKAKEIAYDVAQKENVIARERQKVQTQRWFFLAAMLVIVLLAFVCYYIIKMYARQRRLMTIIVERAETTREKQREQKEKADGRLSALFSELERLMSDEQLFADPDLSREKVAQMLNTNAHYVTDAVKLFTGSNFPAYVNRMRIRAAEQMLHDPKNATTSFAQISNEVGFFSFSAFNVAFRKFTGMTPSAYRKIALKEISDNS